MIRRLTATRYVTPLREGGSLPAVVQADDGELYVMKFVGAGQGAKALVAELVAGELGRALGLTVPEIVFLTLDPALGPSEPDPEIHDLLYASVGLNLGLKFLPNAFAFNALLRPPAPDLASRIVWFDAYVTNVDRTPRNVNMLVWRDELWLIDHGAALYFHHRWDETFLERSRTAFAPIREHTLLPFATELKETDAASRARLTPEVVGRIVDLIPAEWLVDDAPFDTPAEHRQAYVAYLLSRLEAADTFVDAAERARAVAA